MTRKAGMVALVGAIGGGVPALLAVNAYAASLDQNLRTSQEWPMSATKLSGPVAGHAAPVIGPLIAVDPVATLPPADAPRPLAQAKTKAAPPAVAPAAPPQTGAEIVGKLLAPRASDPDVPLPHPNLAEPAAANAASNRPHIFGRGEEGGGVLGLRVPFPADRGGSTANTRSGSGR